MLVTTVKCSNACALASPENIHLISERIAEQSRRVAEVVQRLRGLVRTGSVSKARHDINEIIRNTISLFEYETKNKYFKFDFYPDEAIDILSALSTTMRPSGSPCAYSFLQPV